MFCENCGKEIPDDSRICGFCGEQIHQSGNQYENASQLSCVGEQGYDVAQNFNQLLHQSSKSKVTAGLLGLFLGGWGVHNFYLGYTKKAIIQLSACIVGILLSWLGIGFVIIFGIGIWAFVESILILCGSVKTDGKGLPLK